MGDDGPPVWIGRVTNVAPNPAPYRNSRFKVQQSTATIETVERLHGEAPEVYEFVGATHVRSTSPGDLWCGPYMMLQRGDVVLIIPNGAGDYVLEAAESPPEIRSRLESYQ